MYNEVFPGGVHDKSLFQVYCPFLCSRELSYKVPLKVSRNIDSSYLLVYKFGNK